MANEYYIDLDRLTLYDTQLKTYDSTDVKMNGTAAVGTSKRAARADHVHPTDTSRAPLASPALTGTPTAPTAAAGTNTTQIATTAFVKAAVDAVPTYSDFTGSTGTVAGTHGLVPAPTAAQYNKHVLVADGYWRPVDTVIKHVMGDPTSGGLLRYDPSGSASYDGSYVYPYTLVANDIPNLNTSKLTAGTLGVARGGTGASTLGAGVVYHSASGTGALSIATAANLVSAIGDSAVNRATADASGNNIASTYLTQTDAASTYALKTDVSGIYKYKGSVATAANLPASPSTGDVYNIEAESSYGPAGTNVAWTGSAWDSLGGIFSISTATNAQIEALFS